MKPNQTSRRLAEETHFLPPTVIAAAVAAYLLITLGDCASYAGIAPVAQRVTPTALGLGPGLEATATAAIAIEADWWRSSHRVRGLIECRPEPAHRYGQRAVGCWACIAFADL